ncbi:putative PB1 domain-containing protein [Helianthus debilis subsp. tardiflorus]
MFSPLTSERFLQEQILPTGKNGLTHLIQFWSPRAVGKHQLLTTIDQPFGLGVASEELCSYRKDSERKAFLVDKDHEEEDVSPPARVFRRGLPEWTSDITEYETKDFPQQDCAIRCNPHGYLVLPVFDSTTRSCVGVLEILTSFKYMSYAFEVQQVHKALQAENLTSPQVFDYPTLKIPSERRQNELDKICDILKVVCDIHSLPLAQTWAVSPTSSYVSHNTVIEKTCSSFNTRCIGKVCMSTAALPFHVRDLGLWHFRKACGEQHLDKSRGFVGKTLLDRGSYYCQDVTELSAEEYPLVHYARMNGLTSCFTIFLHSVEGDDGDDYVLEFFLQLGNKDSRHVMNLVQTLKQRVEVASGFELGEISHVQVTEPPRDVGHLSLSTKRHTIRTSSTTPANSLITEMDSSDSESLSANTSEADYASIERVCDNFTGSVESSNLLNVNVTFNESTERFIFSRFDGLSKWTNKVAKRFKLGGQGFRLKYIDEDHELICICGDVDLNLALRTLCSNNSIDLIYEKAF